MRIALVIERMDTFGGGRERSVAEIATELSRRGHEVSVLCQMGTLPESSVRVLPLGRVGLTRSAQMANFIRMVEAEIKSGRYDIVHATLPIPSANIYQPRGGTVVGQQAGKNRLSSPLGRTIRKITSPLNRTRALAMKIERQVVDNLDITCLAVSKVVAEEFSRYYNRHENVRVIYNGVEVPRINQEQRIANRKKWRKRWNISDNGTIFLAVAYNFALKGIPETIKAFAEYKRTFPTQETKLVIVGRDDGRVYQRLVRKTNLDGMVIFESAVEDIFELYCAADAVVLMSWQDACSRVILEAIRMGLPAMTTQYNGAAELLTEGAGIVVPSPRDYKSIITGFEKLANQDARKRMIIACEEKAWFASNKRQVNELENLYHDIVK